MGKGFRLLDWSQEPITRILQLPHIPVTAFSQTDLFLVWIYVEFSSPQEPQWPIAIISTDQCWHVDNFTWSRIVLSSPKRAHVDWNWPISREKYLKIVCKNALALAYYGSCRLLVMGSCWSSWCFSVTEENSPDMCIDAVSLLKYLTSIKEH